MNKKEHGRGIAEGRMNIRTFLSVFVLISLCGIASMAVGAEADASVDERAAANGSVVFERWYAVLMEGNHIGWSHTWEVERGGAEPTIETNSQMLVQIKRGAFEVSITAQNRFVETAAGRPVESSSTQQMGLMSVTKTMLFKDDHIEMIVRQGEIENRQELPMPRVGDEEDDLGWLAPAAMQRFVQERVGAGDESIRCWTLDSSLGVEPTEVVMTVVGRENVDVYGKVVPAVVWDVTVSLLEGVVTREYVDEGGRSVKSTLALVPGMTLTMVQADQELALAPVDAPELLATTMIEPEGEIVEPRGLRRATYELLMSEAEPGDGGGPGAVERRGGLAVPDGAYQRVLGAAGDNGSGVRVTVDLDRRVEADLGAPGEEHLRATTMLDHRDPRVSELLEQALKAQPEDWGARHKADALRRFVHRYILAKDLSVGFATAGEVARTAQGDCTEHAVLLAALLRGAGVPSRTVSGLIYVDQFLGRSGVFGYHMWTQAWLAAGEGGQPGGWVDLDATLAGSAFDAAHIALMTSDMGEAVLVNDLVQLLPMMGRLTVRVVETGVGPVR